MRENPGGSTSLLSLFLKTSNCSLSNFINPLPLEEGNPRVARGFGFPRVTRIYLPATHSTCSNHEIIHQSTVTFALLLIPLGGLRSFRGNPEGFLARRKTIRHHASPRMASPIRSNSMARRCWYRPALVWPSGMA